jgi:hypothetical protein
LSSMMAAPTVTTAWQKPQRQWRVQRQPRRQDSNNSDRLIDRCLYQLLIMCVCLCVFVMLLDMNCSVCLSITNFLVCLSIMTCLAFVCHELDLIDASRSIRVSFNMCSVVMNWRSVVMN